MLVSVILNCFFFFNDTPTTEIYTLSLHDALPISPSSPPGRHNRRPTRDTTAQRRSPGNTPAHPRAPPRAPATPASPNRPSAPPPPGRQPSAPAPGGAARLSEPNVNMDAG